MLSCYAFVEKQPFFYRISHDFTNLSSIHLLAIRKEGLSGGAQIPVYPHNTAKENTHMKKCLSLLLAMLMMMTLCTTFASAEDFALRNGILFGDTMDVILTKETSLVRESETSNWFDGRIAGYNDAQCGFYFDDDGLLISMDYSFSDNICTSRDETNSVYETLYKSLNRKYGTPLNNTGGSCYIITGPAIERMGLYVYLLGTLDGYSADYLDYDEWIVEEDGYSVKIDLISYYYRNDDYDYYYHIDVSYHRFTDEDLKQAQLEKQQENDEIDNDM